MPSHVGPEFFQLRAFIAMLIPPIQLDFDLLGLVLRRLGLSVIDISRDTITIRRERSHPVELETALLQLGRGPIAIFWAAIAPYLRARRITGIRIPCRRCRRSILFCAANQACGEYC